VKILIRLATVALAAAAVLAPAAVTPATAAPSAETAATQVAGWTQVRSTTTSNARFSVIMRDGATLVLRPGESTSYYRTEPRVVQWNPGVCVKVQVGPTGSWWTLPTTRRQWTPPEDKASSVKAWSCTG
jgi:hypothetical protein